jgi:hypothetical protein
MTNQNNQMGTNNQILSPPTFVSLSNRFETQRLSKNKQSYVEEFYASKPYWLLLGICEDGLPLTLNLRNSDINTILIVSDSSVANTNFMLNVISLALKMEKLQLSINLVTDTAQKWIGLLPKSSRTVEITLWEHYLEQILHPTFLSGDQNKGFSLTFLDGLNHLAGCSLEQEQDIVSLIENSRSQRNYYFATINTNDLRVLSLEWLETFRTKVLGKITNLALANQTLRLPSIYRKMPQNNELYIWDGSTWLKFNPIY